MSDAPAGILFLGLARDCEDTLPKFFVYLEYLRKNGIRCSAIIGENGSRDNTRRLLEEVIGPDITLLDTEFMANQTSRLARMAVGRQALLGEAIRRGYGHEYICVIDLDNIMLEPPAPTGLMAGIELLKLNKHLFAVGATSRPFYYDLLSLQTEDQHFRDLYRRIALARKKPFGYYQFYRDVIYANQRLMTRQEVVPCRSSFNGCCLYNASDFRLGTYRADHEADVCEHVTFNLSIGRATGKEMVIIPELVVMAPSDHMEVGVVRFWLDRVHKGVSAFGANVRNIRVGLEGS